jgi:signal transduction histidine kinase
VCHDRATVKRTAQAPQAPRGGGRRPPRGPFSRWPRASNAVLALVVFLVAVFVTSTPDGDLVFRSPTDIPIAGFFVLAGACAALMWRRSQPLVVLWVTVIATTLSTAFGYSETVGIAMLIALYGVGRYAADDRASSIGLGGTFVLVVLSALFHPNTPTRSGAETAAEVAFGLFITFLVWYIGRRIRIRGERAAQLERERAAEARRAIAEERTRIARELHDVVAHRVSLMTVQAGAAKTVVADDPQGAAQAMEAVENAGRQALGELRHLLDVLRPDAEMDGLRPQPGLADVPRLVDQFEEAGLDVSLTIEGQASNLPARVDLSAYRIVQEALTNVLKHAGSTARTEVRLSTDHRVLAIEVVDNGHGDTILPGSGQGIVGMRERAQLLGGSLDAGPRPGGGFQVVALLPIGEAPA